VPPPQAKQHGGEQLHDHGADAGEEAGAELAFQDVGQGRVGLDLEGLRLGVQVAFARCEDDVAACGLQPGAIGVPGARVAVEILVRQELQAVHEDAGDQHVAQRPGLAHEGDVAVVQVAHGGHEGRAAGAGGQGCAQFGDGACGDHGGLRQFQACSWSSGKRPLA